MTVTMKLITELYHHKEGRGRVAGVVLSVTDLGAVVGPVLFSWLYAKEGLGPWGPRLCFLAMAATGAVATVGFFMSSKREKDLPSV
jgi:MFS family permease